MTLTGVLSSVLGHIFNGAGALAVLLAAGLWCLAFAAAFLTDATGSKWLAVLIMAAGTAFAGLTGYACAGELEDGRSRLGRASVIALLGLGGFAIATMMSTMAAIGLIVAAEAGHLPSAAAETLLALREAGSAMLIAGAVTALHPVVWALAYLWHRRSSVRSRYDDLHWSTGTALWFWLLLNAAATAYILWQGPVAQAAS